MKFSKICLSVILILFSSCSNAQQANNQKILIVYLSRTKNTQVLAEIIHSKVGGKLVALELEKPYPENYKATVQQVSDELEKGYLPPLKTKIENLGQYNVVFVGFPTWSMRLPPPMQSFLHENNFKGKTLIPFNTNAGYGIGSTFERVGKLCPDAKILEGFSMIGGKETDGVFLAIKDEKAAETESKVSEWLKKIGVL